jgi:hypothetical protein
MTACQTIAQSLSASPTATSYPTTTFSLPPEMVTPRHCRIAKTVAELTSGQNGAIRQQLIEQLMREIMNYDAEFRREDTAGVIGSHARH